MKLLNANQAAEFIGVSRTTFWEMRKNCPLRSVTVGAGSQRFEVSDLEEWVRGYDPQASYRNHN